MSENNRKIFAKLNRILRGANGIVYLMFLGRETYAGEIQEHLVGTIYTHPANVTQTVGRLKKHGTDFLIFERKHKEEGTRGREAEFYKANIEPIFATLKSFHIDFDEMELRSAFESLSEANDSFPKFLINIFQASVLKSLSWNATLAMYLSYLSELLKPDAPIFPIPSDASVNKEKKAFLLNSHPNLKKNLLSLNMRLSSPSLGWSPQFKEYLAKTMEQLEIYESDARSVLRMLLELKRMGIDDPEKHFSELLERLKEAENFLAKVEKLKNEVQSKHEK